jgi:hypothetical protein
MLKAQRRSVAGFHRSLFLNFTDKGLTPETLLNGEIVQRALTGIRIQRERDNIGRLKYVIEGTALGGRGLTAVVQRFQTRQIIVILTAYET